MRTDEPTPTEEYIVSDADLDDALSAIEDLPHAWILWSVKDIQKIWYRTTDLRDLLYELKRYREAEKDVEQDCPAEPRESEEFSPAGAYYNSAFSALGAMLRGPEKAKGRQWHPEGTAITPKLPHVNALYFDFDTPDVPDEGRIDEAGRLHFQDGPIGTNGVNGLTNEVVLEGILMRIERQNSVLPCLENTLALAELQGALMLLRSRSQRRQRDGLTDTQKENQ